MRVWGCLGEYIIDLRAVFIPQMILAPCAAVLCSAAGMSLIWTPCTTRRLFKKVSDASEERRTPAGRAPLIFHLFSTGSDRASLGGVPLVKAWRESSLDPAPLKSKVNEQEGRGGPEIGGPYVDFHV